MTHSFARVPQANVQRSQFRSPYTWKGDINAGWLVPFLVDEVLPGDTFNDKFSIFARLCTPIKPFIDNLYLDTFYFFVPNRLLWNNWERFNGAQDDPDDSTDYLIPQCPSPTGGYAYGSLQDFMGIPPQIEMSHNALHTRAYNLIWNEFFRDQNLQNSVVVDKDDGPDNPDDYNHLRRGKRHDYFTSCLPWPQKGQAAALSFTGSAPVYLDDSLAVRGKMLAAHDHSNPAAGNNIQTSTVGEFGITGLPLVYDPNGSLKTDLSLASAFTINEFRQAFQLQMMLEMDARGGTRYVEILRAHFGVISPDFRLQRPEYLGGRSSRVTINEVPQTNSSDSTTPQGNLAAYGTVTSVNEGYVKSFVEHGVIIALMCVRADLTYQQGVRRMWSRRTRYDFYWPALAHLGEQAVLNKEIYATGNPVWDNAVFGYQERFAEYRYCPSLIVGQLRTDAPQSLDYWHLSQDLVNPVLNAEFIQDNPPVERISAVQNEPQFIVDVFGDLVRARPMPVFSTPGLITRL